jgi:hypothetical protein
LRPLRGERTTERELKDDYQLAARWTTRGQISLVRSPSPARGAVPRFQRGAKQVCPRISGSVRSVRAFAAQVAGAAIIAANRPDRPPLFAVARMARNEITRRGARRYVRDGFGDIDPTAAGRAAAASAAVASRYAGLIEEVSRNLGLTPEQRASAIASLRQRQSAEAAGASKAVMDEAKGAAKLRRMMKRNKP